MLTRLGRTVVIAVQAGLLCTGISAPPGTPRVAGSLPPLTRRVLLLGGDHAVEFLAEALDHVQGVDDRLGHQAAQQEATV